MSQSHKLGRIRSTGQQARPGKQLSFPVAAVRRIGLISGVSLVALLSIAWAGKVAAEQVVPARVVIRGCWLTETEDVLNAVEFNGMQSVAGIKASAHSYDFSEHRWLRDLVVAQDSLSTALITVVEASPLLLLRSNGDEYWLCDDGTAVARFTEADNSAVFDAILNLPAVELGFADLDRIHELAEPVLLAAACCNELMPGRIKKIAINEAGEFDLFDKHGLRIRLGEPTLLAEKIGALPKALRICEDDGGSLQYLDARDPHVFYQKWNEPISE